MAPAADGEWHRLAPTLWARVTAAGDLDFCDGAERPSAQRSAFPPFKVQSADVPTLLDFAHGQRAPIPAPSPNLMNARAGLARAAATFAAAVLVGNPQNQANAGGMLETAAEALVAAKRAGIVVVGPGGSVPS